MMRPVRALVVGILLMPLFLSSAHADPDTDSIKHALALARSGDMDGAVAIIRPLAESGNGLAQSYLGKAYAAGNGVEKNPSLAVEWWRRAADQGVHEAQFTLGAAIAGGIGVEKDEVEGLKWFIIARTDKDGLAYSMLSKELGPHKTATARARAYRWMFRKAMSSSDNETKLNMLTELSAEKMPQAQYQLGKLYAMGLPGALTSTKKMAVPGLLDFQPDSATAIELYRVAAAQGYAPAQTALAESLNETDEAFDLYRKAAEQGDDVAQARLADMYVSGTRVSRNVAKAIDLYRASAKSRNLHAMHALSDAYSPDGIAQLDPAEAYKWLVLARNESAFMDSEVSKIDHRLASLETMMSSAKVDSAKEAAASCLASDFKDCD